MLTMLNRREQVVFLEALYKSNNLISEQGSLLVIDFLKQAYPELHKKHIAENINEYPARLVFVSSAKAEQFRSFLQGEVLDNPDLEKMITPRNLEIIKPAEQKKPVDFSKVKYDA